MTRWLTISLAFSTGIRTIVWSGYKLAATFVLVKSGIYSLWLASGLSGSHMERKTLLSVQTMQEGAVQRHLRRQVMKREERAEREARRVEEELYKLSTQQAGVERDGGGIGKWAKRRRLWRRRSRDTLETSSTSEIVV